MMVASLRSQVPEVKASRGYAPAVTVGYSCAPAASAALLATMSQSGQPSARCSESKLGTRGKHKLIAGDGDS